MIPSQSQFHDHHCKHPTSGTGRSDYQFKCGTTSLVHHLQDGLESGAKELPIKFSEQIGARPLRVVRLRVEMAGLVASIESSGGIRPQLILLPKIIIGSAVLTRRIKSRRPLTIVDRPSFPSDNVLVRRVGGGTFGHLDAVSC